MKVGNLKITKHIFLDLARACGEFDEAKDKEATQIEGEHEVPIPLRAW